MDKSKIGKNIRKYRREKGLTQKQLGEKSGINIKQISHYEQGRLIPKIETLNKISNVLEVSIETMYFGNDDIICLETSADESTMLMKIFNKLKSENQEKLIEYAILLEKVESYNQITKSL